MKTLERAAAAAQLLSDAGTLRCSSSMEAVELPKHARVLIETTDIACASPASVSLCCVVHVGGGVVLWPDVVNVWISTLPESLVVHADFIVNTVRWLLEPLLDGSSGGAMVSSPPVAVANAVLSLYG